MKSIIKSLLTVALFITSAFHAMAENTDTTAIKWAVGSFQYSEVVIEGEVISDIIYTEYNTPFHAYTIQVSKIFKGMNLISCGTLTAIKLGGWDSLGNGSEKAHGDAFFPVGSKGIFFLNIEDGRKEVPLPTKINNTSSNNTKWFSFIGNAPSFSVIGYQTSLMDTTNWNPYFAYFSGGFNGLIFNNFDEVYQFVKTAFGVDTKKLIDCYSLTDSSPRKFPPVK